MSLDRKSVLNLDVTFLLLFFKSTSKRILIRIKVFCIFELKILQVYIYHCPTVFKIV